MRSPTIPETETIRHKEREVTQRRKRVPMTTTGETRREGGEMSLKRIDIGVVTVNNCRRKVFSKMIRHRYNYKLSSSS
jgi:hypothetical protein